jgi:hypothetical protein
MKKIKALLDFIRLSIPKKIEFYYNVIIKLTNNASFSKTDIPLEEVKESVDNLKAAYLATKDGSHTATSAMYDAEEKADTYFRILAAYVNRIAWGNETTILSSGFNTSKQPSSIQKPVIQVFDADNSGSVYIVARAIENAKAYIWQSAKDKLPETEAGWTTVGHSTQSHFQVTNLSVAAKYYFRVAAITPDGTSDFTSAVMKVVI